MCLSISGGLIDWALINFNRNFLDSSSIDSSSDEGDEASVIPDEVVSSFSLGRGGLIEDGDVKDDNEEVLDEKVCE